MKIYLRQHEDGFSKICDQDIDGHHMIVPSFDKYENKTVECALCHQYKLEEWEMKFV